MMMGQGESSQFSSSHGGAPPSSSRGAVLAPSRQADWVALAEASLVQSGALPAGVQTFPSESTFSSGAPPPTTPSLPVGKAFFLAMQQAWRAPVPEAVAAAQHTANLPPMDPDDIIDAIQDTPGDVLSPPVRLSYMIDCLIELWDDEGLYD